MHCFFNWVGTYLCQFQNLSIELSPIDSYMSSKRGSRSFYISNCTSVVRWTFLFESCNTRVVAQYFKHTLLDDSTTHTMNDEEHFVGSACSNGHVELINGFLSSHSTQIHCVLWRSHYWAEGTLFMCSWPCGGLLRDPALTLQVTAHIMYRNFIDWSRSMITPQGSNWSLDIY